MKEQVHRATENALDRIIEASEEIAWRLDATVGVLEDPGTSLGEDERRELVSLLRSISYYFHNLKVSVSAKDVSTVAMSAFMTASVLLWSLELLRDTLRAKLGANNNAERRD